MDNKRQRELVLMDLAIEYLRQYDIDDAPQAIVDLVTELDAVERLIAIEEQQEPQPC